MAHRSSLSLRIISTLTAYSFLFSNTLALGLAYGGQIVPDGKTQTSVNIQKNVTDITTSTIRGKNAYNSFSQFDVNAGNIANLHVPGSATNLLNLVHDKVSNIDGVLNAYKNGSIGGNVFFANPHGLVVGAGGVINVGSLTVSTPTKSFMAGFFDDAGNPTDVATQHILGGTAPINGSALISIEGQINALDSVKIQAGDIINRGVITAGVTAPKAIAFVDLVNTDNFQTGAGIVERNGEIFILAENDFTNAGLISVDGASHIDGGNVVVRAQHDIILSTDSNITARGLGENSSGGNVLIFADNNSTLKNNATLDVRGGDISGDGGFVEFSAKEKVVIEKGSGDRIKASATSGDAGTILIDPNDFELVDSNMFTDGAAFILEANKSIIVDDGFIISTRNLNDVNTDDHDTAVSKGNSGNITLIAPEISLDNGSKLFAHVIQDGVSEYVAGDVTLTASATDHAGLTIAEANSNITIDGATIKAKNITLSSKADAAYDWGGDTDDILVGLVPTLGRALLTQLFGVNVGLAIARGTSSVTIKNGSLLQATETVDLTSETNAAASTYTIAKPAAAGGAFALGIIYGETTSHATVDVQTGATIKARDLTIDARNTADLNLNVYAISTSDSANAAVAIGNADVKSEAKIASGANINISKDVSITAVNNDRFAVASSAIAIEGGKAGIAASFLFADNSATAYSNANMNTAGLETVKIEALDNNVKNRVTSSTDAGSGIIAKKVTKYIVKGVNAAANKMTSFFLDTKDAAPGASAKPKFAGSLSYADSKQTASASIGNDVILVASKDVTVTAKVEDARLQNHAASTVASETDNPTPDNPAATIGVSVAVAYGDYTHNADAHIGDGAQVTAQHVGVRSDVLMPWEQTWWKWEGLTSIISKLNGNLGVANGLLTGYANAQSAADNFALAGAVTWLDFNNSSTAYLGKSSSITILPGGTSPWTSMRTDGIAKFIPITEFDIDDGLVCALTLGCTKLRFVDEQMNWADAVNVLANNEIEGVFSSGNLGITLAGTGSENGGKAVGASFNQIAYTNVTKAFIAEGASVKQQAASAAVDVNVEASSRENLIVVSPTAGRGASFGLNGQVSIATVNDTTEASIDDEAQVEARKLQVKAADELVTWSLSGAFNMSDAAAVGIAVAYTDVTTRTNAFIGDNDSNFLAGSTLALTDGAVAANDIAVTARTDGKIESIAVAATLAKSDAKEPPVAGGKTFAEKAAEAKTASKWTKAKKAISDKLNKVPSNDKSWIAPPETPPKFGVGISGAASVNISDLDTKAYITHPKVTGTGPISTLDISAVNDTDITAAAGSAALTRANAPSSKRSAAFAGAVTVNILDNDTSAYIEDSSVTDFKDVDMKALEGGEQLSVAIGAAVNASADKSKAASVAGSVSISQTDNSVNAYIKNSTVLGNNDGADRGDLNIIAYDRTKLGTGAGSLFGGGKGGFGAAVTYSDIDNVANAYIEQSTIADLVAGHGGYETIQVQALTAAKIAAGGGVVGVTTAEGGNSLAGVVVVNDINNIVSADIKGNSTVIATDSVEVLARDINAVASLDAIIDSEDNGNANASSVDYDGTTIGLAAPSGSSILAVAGVVQVGLNGGNNVGASVTRNTISNKITAHITDSVVKTQIKLLPGMADPTGISTDPAIVSLNPVTTGNINVIARSDAKITGIAVGVGYAKDGFAGAGSATSNEIENEVRAEISSSSTQKISTNALTLSAEDKSKIESLAGQVTISTGAAAIGLSLAHNEINNKVFASATGVDIDARLSTQVKAENASTIRTLSATAGGSKDFAFNGAVSIGLIGNETEAKIVDSKADTSENKTIVWAKDRSKIEALSGGAAVATKGAGVGLAVAVNRIAGSTKAHVSGSALNSAYNLEHLKVWSDSLATINTISVGIGAGKDVGLGGSITTNFIDNDVLAYIDDGAKVVAQNYVGVITESDDRLTVAAGSAGVGLGSAGVGVSFGYNSINGSAKAYIEGTNTGTEVSAYGKDPGDASYGLLEINTGLLNSSVDLAQAVDLANYNKVDLRSLKETEFVRGIAVNASSTQHVESIGGNIAAGVNGLGLVTTINTIAGTTDAYIQNSKINGLNTDGTSRQDINVIASNHAYGNGFVGNLSIGVSGAAAGAAVDTHQIARNTRAFINGGLLAAKGDLKVKAYTTQGVSSLAVGGSAGGNAIAGTLSYAKFVNTTEAFIRHADVSAGEVTVEADNENNLHLVAGAVSIGGNAGGGAFTVGLNESKTNAYILGSDYDAYRTQIKTDGAVNVKADARTNIGHTAVAGAAAGSVGVAGSVSVNILNGTTQAYIKQADVGSDINKVGQVTVSAHDSVALDTDAGSVAIGGTAGVGASVAVNILKSRVTSNIEDSKVYSSQAVEVSSASKNNIKSLTFTGGAGGTVGISGAVVVNMVGSDVVDTAKGGDEANDEAGGTIGGVDSAISGIGDTVTEDILPGSGEILTSDESNEMKNNTGSSVKAISYGNDAAAAKYQTSANVVGANSVIDAVSLNVVATDSTSTKSTVGGVAGGALGLGAGVGVTKVKANVIAGIGSGVGVNTSGNIDVKATAQKDTGEVVNMLAFAGAGGLVGLGAAVAIANVDNKVTASNYGDTDSLTGTVNVEAKDSSDMLVEGGGAVVGGAAAGVVVARATKTSVVTASSGASTINAKGASVKAKSEGMIVARTQSAAGGLTGAGNGAAALAKDNSTVIASTADFSTFNLGAGTMTVEAEASPQTDALAQGITVSGGYSIGASVAEAEADVNVIASLGQNNLINAGNLTVAAKQTLGNAISSNSQLLNIAIDACTINCVSARANAFAASGGLLLGANATVSDTTVTGRINTMIGADTRLVISGKSLITANLDSDQYAMTKSFSGGLAAIGGAFSSGNADTKTQVTIADGVNITTGGLTVRADGDVKNLVKAKSGSGGAVAGAAAVAHTDNTSVTSVSVGNGSITTSNLDIDAEHTTRFDHETDSTSGGLLGASGAVANNKVDAQVSVTLAGNIEAGVIDARSSNNVYKNLVSGYNVNAGAGGLLGGAAADSNTKINRMTSSVTIAQDSIITSGEHDTEGVTLEASNHLLAVDRAKLDSGGAIAIALADASVIASNVAAEVTVGDSASIETGGNLIAAAYSDLDVQVDAKASTYGLAGAAQGESTASVTAKNTVTAGVDTTLRSTGQTKLMAGRTATGQATSQTILAFTDLWNKTAFPVETNPEADAYLKNTNRVNVAQGSVVGAADDIYLIADKGTANVNGQGIGKDLYRQAAEDTVNFFGDLVGADDVSFDITGGSSTNISTEAVSVDGFVNAGIDNKLKFKIRRTGSNELAFYEGDYPEGADDAYFDGLTPTVTLTMNNGVLSGVDGEGNPVVINYDAGSGKFTVVSSDDGLSTTFDLDATFNPMEALETRLAAIQVELDALKYTAGIYTPAEVTQRETLGLELEKISADIAALQVNMNAIQDVTGSGAGLTVASLAGILQMRGEITKANSAAAAETLISAGVNDPIEIWTKQVAGLTKVRADVLAQSNANNAAEINQVVARIDTQVSGITTKLINAANRIDANIAVIKAGGSADAITAARAQIILDRNLMNSYDTTLAGESTTVSNRIGTLEVRQTAATSERNGIVGTASGDSAFEPFIKRLEQEGTWIAGRVAEYAGGTQFELIDFTEQLTAHSANIYVDSDVLSGRQNLVANRDTEVSVYNDSEAYMRISGGAEIPFAAGGKVLLNNAQINKGAEGVAKIEFVNDYRPSDLDTPGPDLIIDGDISNYNGDILLRSAAGGVQTGAGVDVDANTVRIVAGRDVILSYTGGIRHLGGDVKCDFDAGNDCTQSEAIPGLIAGNNVYIAGEYLNINAKIQSGRPDIVVEVNGLNLGEYGIRTVDAAGNSILENDGSLVLKTTANGESYFELKPQIVAGGYVDLYGHIMSTSNSPTSTSGDGEIQVMDGYGRIQVTNNTAYDIVVDGLSAGTGVEGRVRINDLDHDLLGAGNDKMTEYTYHRDNGLNQQVEVKVTWNDNAPLTNFYNDEYYFIGADGLAYQPLADQHYSWENIVKKGYTDKRSVERDTYFGLFSDTTSYNYGPIQTTETSGAPIKDDLLLVVNTPIDSPYWNTFKTVDVDATGFARDSGSYDIDEYVVYRNETWTESRSRNNYDYTKHYVKADNPIDINFVGYGSGLVNLLSNGGGGFDLAGDIRNSRGATNIITNGAVTQSNPEALLSSREFTLSAGSAGQVIAASGAQTAPGYVPLQVNIDRLLSANVTAGDLVLEQALGDLVFGDADASGNVWLKSSGDIINDKTLYPAGDNTISGKRVTLIAENGAVGDSTANGLDRFILVNTEASAAGGLEVIGANDIFVSETNGDLQLVSAVSTAGDVYVDVQDGNLVDNNPVETADTRTIEQLLGIWDEMEFITKTTGANGINSAGNVSLTHDVADRNVRAKEELKTREYQTYWSYRNRLADPSAPITDTTIVLSQTEAGYFSNPKAVADERSAEFARLNELYGGLGNSYNENYTYKVVVGSAEYKKLTEKAGWTELELLASFGPGLLKEISDTEIRIEDANASGNNVNITVQNGDIGTYTPDDILIDLDTVADYTELSDAQKLALLTAERRDVRLAGYDNTSGSYRQMWISTYDDVDVEVANTLTISAPAAEHIYIGSESNLDISGIVGLGDVRIRTNGNLTGSAADGIADVIGKDILLESGSQSIGTANDFFRVSHLNDGSLTARAGDSIWLDGMNDHLAIDTVFAKDLFSLKSIGDVVEFLPDAGVDVRAASVLLDIGGSFGAAGALVNAIDIGLNPDGILTAKIMDGAWITSPDRDLHVGRFEAGGTVALTGGADMTIGDLLNTGGATDLTADGNIKVTKLNSTLGNLYMASIFGSLNMGDGTVGGNVLMTAGENINIDNLLNTGGATDLTADGNIKVTKLNSTLGNLHMTSIFGSLDMGDGTVGGNVLMTAGKSINIQSLLNTGDVVDLVADDSIKISNIESTTGKLNLNDIIARYGSVDIQLSGNGQINNLLAALNAKIVASGDSLNIDKTVSDTLNLTVLNEGGQLDVADATVSTRLTAMADNINMPAVLHSPALAVLHVNAAGNDGDLADFININIKSSIGFIFDTFKAKKFDLTFTHDNLVLKDFVVGENGWINTPIHKIYIDNVNRYLEERATAQLYAPGKPFGLTLTNQNLLFTDAWIINYKPTYIVNGFSTENSLVLLGSKRLALQQNWLQEMINRLSAFSRLSLLSLGLDEIIFDEEIFNNEDDDSISDELFLKLTNVEPAYNQGTGYPEDNLVSAH